jgi:hypothetical protein
VGKDDVSMASCGDDSVVENNLENDDVIEDEQDDVLDDESYAALK